MSRDAIVEFVQTKFRPRERFSDNTGTRPPLPDWIARRRGDEPSSEADEPMRVDGGPRLGETIRVEGDPNLDEPPPAADGVTPDALAFYLPFHFYLKSWGIYVRTSGVWTLARRLEQASRLPRSDALDFAYRILLDHERLHFIAEYAASRIEVLTAQEVYKAYFAETEAGLHEEALANARALEGSKRVKAFQPFYKPAILWMDRQGPGYSDFLKWIGAHFIDGERRSAAFMTIPAAVANRLALSPKPARASEYAFHPADFLLHDIPLRSVPLYIVMDRSALWLRVAKPFPKDFGLQVFTHSKEHKPPHIHIECPPGTFRTRYRWPELIPVDNNPPLRSGEEEDLRRYVLKHHAAIDKRVKAIPWQ